ncbi:hypothetical protein KY348_02110 [Candidatus Woesearchaeota archaeon]|nr:hypothetical protein [Candidatus Woesearchaeota archaeon]
MLVEAKYLLEQAGLTKNEVKTYLALLEIGLTTTSAIIKKTGINTSKVYESLERLLKKGLVSYSIIKNKKHWQAENPERIKEFLEEEKKKIEQKEKAIEKIIPELLLKKQLKEDTAQYKVYEGIKGIKTARENVLNVLKKRETFYIILSNYPEDKKLEAYWVDFQKRRSAKGIKCKYILNQTLKKTGAKRKKIPLSQTKYVTAEILSPTWMEIYSDHVGIGVLSGKPSIFVIKNKEIAKGFLNYFNFLWKTSNP